MEKRKLNNPTNEVKNPYEISVDLLKGLLERAPKDSPEEYIAELKGHIAAEEKKAEDYKAGKIGLP